MYGCGRFIILIWYAYFVGLFVHRLHHHHVSGLVNPVDWRLQLHLVAQLPGHTLTDLARATYKLPLLQMLEISPLLQSMHAASCALLAKVLNFLYPVGSCFKYDLTWSGHTWNPLIHPSDSNWLPSIKIIFLNHTGTVSKAQASSSSLCESDVYAKIKCEVTFSIWCMFCHFPWLENTFCLNSTRTP